MDGYYIPRNNAVTVSFLAAGGLILYYLWKKAYQSSASTSHALNIPKSVYDVVKSLCKQHFEHTEVILVQSAADWDRAYSLMTEDLKLFKVLGMDCEWVTKGKTRKAISMLQLSTLHCTALIRMHLLEADIPESLTQLLEDKSFLKVGVGALEDRDKFLADYLVPMAGCVDLRYMAGRHQKSWSNDGLKTLAEQVVGIKLDKSKRLRCGNWEEEYLPESMQCYAAGDSQAGLAIFMCLVALKLQNASWEGSTDSLLEALQKRALPMCHGIVDFRYKSTSLPANTSMPNLQVPTTKTSSKSISTNALRSKAMYSNCVMEAPDGQVLCVCDVKKAQWYCDKELADRVSEEGAEEMVIRLRFEPRGRPSTERDYYRSRKENICVVCGADKSFIRKNIVPREYRKHFPAILKSHSSHDVVLLCSTCHQKSGASDQQYKLHFAELCNATYKSGGVTVDNQLKKVKSAARTLNGYADRVPAEKLQECKRILYQFYGTEEITNEMLESATKLDERSTEPNDHGLAVVQYYLDNSTIQEFQKLWRTRFMEVMSPKHMGDYWHVDYDHLDYLWVKTDTEIVVVGSDTVSS